jgi:acyl-CoA reductase-like NAD-dependent aldehyde dehydrogenase
LIKIAELIERDIDKLASIESLDSGKAFMRAKMGDVGVLAMRVSISTGTLLWLRSFSLGLLG